jgi:hypothetical protein
MVADNRHRACGNRGIDEARTVGLAARKCEEEIVWLDRAAVEGNAGYVERRDRGLDCGVIALNVLIEEVAQLHGLPVDMPDRIAEFPGKSRLSSGNGPSG